MLPNKPKLVTDVDLAEIFKIDVEFKAKGVRREDGPTEVGLERRRQRELAAKEQ